MNDHAEIPVRRLRLTGKQSPNPAWMEYLEQRVSHVTQEEILPHELPRSGNVSTVKSIKENLTNDDPNEGPRMTTVHAVYMCACETVWW